MNAPIIDSKLKAQRTNLNKLDRLPPGRISGHSKEFALIVPNVSSFSGLSSCFGLSGFFSLLVLSVYLFPLVFLA